MSTPLTSSPSYPSVSASSTTKAVVKPSLHLPPSLLTSILSHLLGSPFPPSLLLVSKTFNDLSLPLLYRTVALSHPHQYRSFLSDSRSTKEGWKQTTTLKLTIAQFDSIALVWLPRLMYLASLEGGLGARLKTVELEFGGEAWVGGTISSVQQLFLVSTSNSSKKEKGFPFIEHLVLKEYVAPSPRIYKPKKQVVQKKTKKQPRASKKKSKVTGANAMDVDDDEPLAAPSSETAASIESETNSGLPTPSSAYLKLLAKLLSSSSSSNLQTLSLPLLFLVHPSSPFFSSLPSISTLIVLPPLEGTDDDEVQVLVDGLESWLKKMFGGPASKGRKMVEKAALRRLD